MRVMWGLVGDLSLMEFRLPKCLLQTTHELVHSVPIVFAVVWLYKSILSHRVNILQARV